MLLPIVPVHLGAARRAPSAARVESTIRGTYLSRRRKLWGSWAQQM